MRGLAKGAALAAGSLLLPLLLTAAPASRPGPSATARVALALPTDTMHVRMHELGRYGGRFVTAHGAGPKTFNPVMANESSSNDIIGLIYGTLTDFDNTTQEAESQLARRWEESRDGLTWTWHLRRGLRFSDGHPLTSADVLFSFAVAYDTTLRPTSGDLLLVDGQRMKVTAPDAYTVVTRLPKPYVMMVHAIGALRILPKHVLEPVYRRGQLASAYSVSTPPKNLVTSGPFRLKQYVANEKTVLERNPYWFGVDARGRRLPYLDEVVFRVVPDQSTAALMFEAGELDGLEDVKPEDYRRYADGQAKGGYTLYDLGPSLNTNFLWFNLNRVREERPGRALGDPVVDPALYALFSNVSFRRAVSMAIDRDAIIRGVMFGDAVKTWATTTPGNKIWFDPTVTGPDYNPEEAKRLLAGLGLRDTNGDGVLEDAQGHPVSFTIKTNATNQLRVSMANFIRDDLAKVGIRAIPAPVEFNTLVTNLQKDFQYEAILLGLQSGVPPDPGMGQNIWRSSGGTHFWNVHQPSPETPAEAEIDRLIAANVATDNMVERKRTWHRIQEIMNDQCFFIWLPVIRFKAPVSNRFGNLEPSVIPHRLLWNADRIYEKSAATRN